MTINLYNATLEETGAKGFVSYDYKETYLIIMSDPAASPFAVLAHIGLPAPRSSYLIPTGDRVYVTRRSPHRVQDGTNKKWMVDVTYSNNQQSDFLRNTAGEPVETPPDAAKTVDISYEEISVSISDALFISTTLDGPASAGGTVTPSDSWLEYRKGSPGNIVNSAGTPVPDQSKNTYRKRLAVSRYELGYNTSYFDYLGAINNDSVTITQSDSSGPRYQETFGPRRLMIKDITKEDFWYNSILYYRIGFVLDVADNIWAVEHLDEGTKRFVSASQINPETGAVYTIPELTSILGSRASGWNEITTSDGFGGRVAIGGPVPFDGKGNEVYEWLDYSQRWLNWAAFKEKPFTPLNL